MHVKHTMGNLMLETIEVVIFDENGAKLKLKSRCVKISEYYGCSKANVGKGIAIAELQRHSPTVFDLSPVAMRRTTLKMEMLAVSLDDVE